MKCSTNTKKSLAAMHLYCVLPARGVAVVPLREHDAVKRGGER